MCNSNQNTKSRQYPDGEDFPPFARSNHVLRQPELAKQVQFLKEGNKILRKRIKGEVRRLPAEFSLGINADLGL
jgi:hypothetical protein